MMLAYLDKLLVKYKGALIPCSKESGIKLDNFIRLLKKYNLDPEKYK